MLPELVEEKPLCKGKRVELVQRLYRYNNDFFIRDVVKFGQSIAIVPLKENRKVIMIKQFRAPIGKWILEIPAGRIELGESSEEAVIRELKEEIGYVPKNVQKLVSVYISPGYSDEVLHIYLAKDLVYVGATPEKGELIEVVEVDLDKALEIVLENNIIDVKTLIALLMVRQHS